MNVLPNLPNKMTSIDKLMKHSKYRAVQWKFSTATSAVASGVDSKWSHLGTELERGGCAKRLLPSGPFEVTSLKAMDLPEAVDEAGTMLFDDCYVEK